MTMEMSRMKEELDQDDGTDVDDDEDLWPLLGGDSYFRRDWMEMEETRSTGSMVSTYEPDTEMDRAVERYHQVAAEARWREFAATDADVRDIQENGWEDSQIRERRRIRTEQRKEAAPESSREEGQAEQETKKGQRITQPNSLPMSTQR